MKIDLSKLSESLPIIIENAFGNALHPVVYFGPQGVFSLGADNTVASCDLVKSDKSFCLDAKIFSKVFDHAKPGNPVLQLDDDKATVIFGKSKYTLCADTAGNPSVPVSADSDSDAVDAGNLIGALAECLIAAPKKDFRRVLQSVCIRGGDACATDGKVLIRRRVDNLGGVDCVIDSKFASLIAKYKAEKFSITENFAIAYCGDVTIASRPVEGVYPNLDAVIPKDIWYKVNCNRAELIKACQACKVTTNNLNCVIFEIQGNEIKLESASQDVGKTESYVSCESNCKEKLTIAFNIDYLVSMLKMKKDENVILEIDNNQKPVLFDVDENGLSLVMSIKLSEVVA